MISLSLSLGVFLSRLCLSHCISHLFPSSDQGNPSTSPLQVPQLRASLRAFTQKAVIGLRWSCPSLSQSGRWMSLLIGQVSALLCTEVGAE